MKKTKNGLIKVALCICVIIGLLYLTENLKEEYIETLIISGCGSELVSLIFEIIYNLFDTYKEYKNIDNTNFYLGEKSLCLEDNIVLSKITNGMNYHFVYIKEYKKKMLLDEYIIVEYSYLIEIFE